MLPYFWYNHKLDCIMLSYIGQNIFHYLSIIGQYVFFIGRIIVSIREFGIRFRLFVGQILFIGIHSLSIVVITSFFIGMGLSVQIIQQLVDFGATQLAGGVVAISIWRELSALLIGIVLSARVGASITAEIGAMNVNEQIEALIVMGQTPMSYLVVPRIMAVMFFAPILVGVADIIAFGGGFLVSVMSADINYVGFIESARMIATPIDIVWGLVKGLLFSCVVALNATFLGLNVTDGSHDIGKKTMQSVVSSITIIFILNYLLSLLFVSR